MDINTEEKKDQGFTLVELLIVIVILGILAAVTVFAVRGITDSAEDSVCETELASVQTAAEAYFVQNNEAYPTTATLSSLWTGGTYLRESPSETGALTIDADGNVSAANC